MQDGLLASEHARRAARTYGAAADHYTLAKLGFWDWFGAATVSRLGLGAGETVLDLCCGAGASAIPAAHSVGPTGRVLGIDAAAPLLDLARTRAASDGLANAEFRHGDATSTGLADGGFDAVACVFGVFFAPDMTAFVTQMWRLVRPGGVLAVTTWGPGLFEPANSRFWRRVGEAEPALFKAFNPWDEITTPRRLPSCSRALACQIRRSWPSPTGTTWGIRTGSGISCSVPATGPRPTRSARRSSPECESASSATCAPRR